MKTKIFKGVGIQHTNGIIYLPEEWKSNGFSSEDASGIAVGNGTHSLCLYKEAKSGLAWSSDYKLINAVFTTKDEECAAEDFAGKSNTDAILSALAVGIIADAPAVQWVRSNTFSSGAYLPAAGELVMIANNETGISVCSNLICGNLSDMFCSLDWLPWSSTQHQYRSAWTWNGHQDRLDVDDKIHSYSYYYTLACAAL